MRNLPNALSLLRLAASPALVVLALGSQELAFLGLLTLMGISDALDGWLARRWNQCSELGACLDGWADRAMYLCVPLGVASLWPEIVLREASWLCAIGAMFALNLLAALVKFGRPTSYHSRSAKLAAVAMAFALLFLFGSGAAGPFHAASVLLLAAQAEELLITLRLDRWRTDVSSLFHARRGPLKSRSCVAGAGSSRGGDRSGA